MTMNFVWENMFVKLTLGTMLVNLCNLMFVKLT